MFFFSFPFFPHHSLHLLERPGLINPSRVDQLQMKIINSLRDHCTYNFEAQKKANYFSKILSILPELRTVSMAAAQRINRLNQVVTMPITFSTLFDSASLHLL